MVCTSTVFLTIAWSLTICLVLMNIRSIMHCIHIHPLVYISSHVCPAASYAPVQRPLISSQPHLLRLPLFITSLARLSAPATVSSTATVSATQQPASFAAIRVSSTEGPLQRTEVSIRLNSEGFFSLLLTSFCPQQTVM